MKIFGLVFILYYFRLSVGIGFSVCVVSVTYACAIVIFRLKTTIAHAYVTDANKQV